MTTTIYTLIEDFLQGSGIPCPTLFAEVRDSFSSAISLDMVDTAAFRSRVFLWAATGSPTIDPGLQGVSVCSFHIQYCRDIVNSYFL